MTMPEPEREAHLTDAQREQLARARFNVEARGRLLGDRDAPLPAAVATLRLPRSTVLASYFLGPVGAPLWAEAERQGIVRWVGPRGQDVAAPAQPGQGYPSAPHPATPERRDLDDSGDAPF